MTDPLRAPRPRDPIREPPPSAAEYAVRVVELRGQLRDAIQTLSNARRAEVWETVNALLHLERLDASR